jgi:hypothetical protein
VKATIGRVHTNNISLAKEKLLSILFFNIIDLYKVQVIRIVEVQDESRNNTFNEPVIKQKLPSLSIGVPVISYRRI